MDNQALIITDSLGAPRDIPYTRYKDTWVSMVEDYFYQEHGIKTFAFTQRGLSTQTALEQIEEQLQFYTPKIVILQIGIVDCSPRLIKFSTIQNLSKLLPLKVNLFLDNFKRFLFTSPKLSKYRFRSDVDVKDFEKNINTIVNRYFKDSIIVYIPIGWPNKRYVFESKYIRKFVEKYNDILKRFNGDRYFYLEKIDDIVKKNIYKIYDKKNRHYTVHGHKVIADIILSELTQIENFFCNFTIKKSEEIINYNTSFRVKNVLKQRISPNSQVYIMGAGEYSKNLYKIIKDEKSFSIQGFIDSNKKENIFLEKPVLARDFLQDIEEDITLFIATSKYEKKIYQELKSLNKKNFTIIKVPSLLEKEGILI